MGFSCELGLRALMLMIFTWALFLKSNVSTIELGEPCNKTADCSVTHPNSYCTLKKCKCTYGYQNITNKCAAPLGKDCSKDLLCINMVTNACVGKNPPKCQCKDGYEAVGGICKGHLLKGCTNDEECLLYLSGCSQDNICDCREGLKAFPEENRCKAEYNNFCTISGGGCNTPNARCIPVDSSTRCLCKKGYEYDNETGMCIGEGSIATISIMTLVFSTTWNLLLA